MPIYSTLTSIRSILFSSFKFYPFFVELPKRWLQEGSKCSTGGITLYLLSRRQHQQTRHLLPFSPVDRRTFGLTIRQSIKTWQGLDKRQGALYIKVSQEHIEIKDCYCYRTQQQENTKTTLFLSHNRLFLQAIYAVIGGHTGWRMGIQGVLKVLQDGDRSP